MVKPDSVADYRYGEMMTFLGRNILSHVGIVNGWALS